MHLGFWEDKQKDVDVNRSKLKIIKLESNYRPIALVKGYLVCLIMALVTLSLNDKIAMLSKQNVSAMSSNDFEKNRVANLVSKPALFDAELTKLCMNE